MVGIIIVGVIMNTSLALLANPHRAEHSTHTNTQGGGIIKGGRTRQRIT